MRLGKNQLAILRAMERHRGSWSRTSGWVWTTAHRTEQYMRRLEQLGLVASRETRSLGVNRRTRVVYELTKAGLDELECRKGDKSW